MSSDLRISIWHCFSGLRDPRQSVRENKHLLLDIIATSLCAVIAGAKEWPEVVAFAQERRQWLRTFLSLPHGIPSASTFKRVFAALSPAGLRGCLYRWLHACNGQLNLDHVAIDGKTLRGSGDTSEDLAMLHLVSAWASAAKLSLGQVAVEDKSNEIVAIPRLLRLLQIKGALVTIDAMGCQKAIAEQIIEQGGDYALMVKCSQPTLHQEILNCFIKAQDKDFEGCDWEQFESQERGHGREEKRVVTLLYDLEGLSQREQWKELKVIGMCYRERIVGPKSSEEISLFIGSRRESAQYYAGVLRDHWSIENNLHWQLDVTFKEDASRIQDRNAAQNFALLRKWALGLLKQHPDKGSIAVKQYKAALNPQFLQEVIHGP